MGPAPRLPNQLLVKSFELEAERLEDRYWWYARFRIFWPNGQPPDWAVGAVLADQIVAPVLRASSKDIALWRFHRRAARDASGHQFSFIFYATNVYRRIGEDATLQALLAENIVEAYVREETTEPGRPNISSTSDPEWPESVQQAWPIYIMGVSATWLDLIRYYRAAAETQPDTTEQLVALYRSVHEQIEEVWPWDAQHAFFHHMSAMFGYTPVTIRKRIQFWRRAVLCPQPGRCLRFCELQRLLRR